MIACVNQNSRCDSTEAPSCGHRRGTACWVCCHPLHLSRTIYARFRRKMGVQVHRSPCSEFLGFPLFPRGQAPCSASPRLSFDRQNQSGLECNRGTTKRTIGSHLRQRNRGTHLFHLYGVPNRTKSIRNGYFARSHISIGWMDGALSSSLVSDHSVDYEQTAPRRPRE